jgi:hypothetical protein
MRGRLERPLFPSQQEYNMRKRKFAILEHNVIVGSVFALAPCVAVREFARAWNYRETSLIAKEVG